jgi:hypothetical protein
MYYKVKPEKGWLVQQNHPVAALIVFLITSGSDTQ